MPNSVSLTRKCIQCLLLKLMKTHQLMSYSEYGWHTLLYLFFKLKPTKPTKKTKQKQQNKCPHPNFKVPLPLTGYYLLKNVDSANRSPVPFVRHTSELLITLKKKKKAEVPLLVIWFRHM